MGRRRRALGVAVVAAALAAAGAIAVSRSGPADPDPGATLIELDRVYAVPLVVPRKMALNDIGTSDATGAFGAAPGDPEVDSTLRFASSPRSLTVSSGRPRPLEPIAGASPVTLPSGIEADAKIAEDGTISVRWVEPGGPVVLLVANGVDLDELVEVASSMWFVTADTWERLTRDSGFLPPKTGRAGFDAWTPPGDGGELELSVVGSLQTGFLLSFPSAAIALSGRPSDSCRAVSTDRRNFVLVGPTGTTQFTVTDVDGTERPLPATSAPGLPGRAMATWRSAGELNEVDVRVSCDGAVS